MKSIILFLILGKAFEELAIGGSKAALVENVLGLPRNILGESCNALELSRTPFSECYMPSDPVTLISSFLTDVAGKGCKIPPQGLIDEAVVGIKAENIASYPLYNRIPTTGTCGSCARKAKCCKPLLKALSFLTQSWKSEVCGSSAPCVVDEISDADKIALQEIQPEVVFDGNRCNFNQYTDDLLSRVALDQSYVVVSPAMTQLLGTNSPRFRCESVPGTGKCKCCCTAYDAVNGVCAAS